MVTMMKRSACWFLLVASTVLATDGCAGTPTIHERGFLREGIYVVTSRTCEGARDEQIECSRTRYIELVQGKFYGVAKDQLALVDWMALDAAAGPYTYEARPLRGHYRHPNQYVVEVVHDEQYDAQEWLVLDDDLPLEYLFRRTPSAAAAGDSVSVRFKLSPVPRSAALARLMPYPAPVSAD
jgi:hypothetical protein